MMNKSFKLQYVDGLIMVNFNHRRHNENGPALINRIGDKFYYLEGWEFSKEEWEVSRNFYFRGKVK